MIAFLNFAMFRSVYAYIDIATTAYIIQIAAGVFIAAGAAIAVFWKKISAWMANTKNKMAGEMIKRKANKQKDNA